MMYKTKRNPLLAAVLTGALAFSPVSVITQPAFADGGIVAMASTSVSSIDALKKAISDKASEIKLTSSMTMNADLDLSYPLNLDLGGRTLTMGDKSVLVTGDSVVIKNGTIEFTGSGRIVQSGGSLTLGEGAKVTAKDVALSTSGGKTTISGATITSTNGDMAVYASGSVVSITDGEIRATGTDTPLGGVTYSISGGTFSGRVDDDDLDFGYKQVKVGSDYIVLSDGSGLDADDIATVSPKTYTYTGQPIEPTSISVSDTKATKATIEGYNPTNHTDVGDKYVIVGYKSSSDGTYKTAVGAFTITKRPITITAKDVDISSLTTAKLSSLKAEVSGLADGHKLDPSSYEVVVGDYDAYEEGYALVVKPASGGFRITDADGNDVTSNYSITTEDGILTGTYDDLAEALLTSALLGDSGSLSSATATVDDVTYNGKEQTPKVTVKIGSTDVTDKCSFTYSNNKNVGTAKVKITPKSNTTGQGSPSITESGSQSLSAMATSTVSSVTGSKTVEFKIKPAAATVEGANTSKKVGEKDPTLATVKGMVNNESTSLIKYDVTRVPGETEGTYKITPTGDKTQGNYEVTYKEGTLTITGASGTSGTSGTTSNKASTTTGTTGGTTTTTGTTTTATTSKAATANTGDSTFMGGAAIAAAGVGLLGFGIFRKKARKQ